MLRYCLWISVCLLALSGNAQAMSSISDGELVVTLNNNLPCFSYPQDEATKVANYRLAHMSIIWNDQASSLPGNHAWTVEAALDEKRIANPNSPDTCITYGLAYLGAYEKKGPAKPFRFDIPYHAHMSIFTEATYAKFYDRKYDIWFCFRRNTSGNPVILKAMRNSATGKFECQQFNMVQRYFSLYAAHRDCRPVA